MYCEKCGQEIPDHATFCGKCGAKIGDTEQQDIGKKKRKPGRDRKVLLRIGQVIAIAVGVIGIAFWISSRAVPMNKAKVGSTVVFGSFEQDNDLENGTEPIEWIVLDKQGDKLLLLSKKVLDSRNYYGAYYPVTWEESHLRFWLNSVFYETAFTEEEQQKILLTEVVNDDNPDYGTDGGNDTEDNIFLFSIKEVKEYLPGSRRSEGTAYAMDKGLATDSENYAYWWLRSPGRDTDTAAYVTSHHTAFATPSMSYSALAGGVYEAGCLVGNDTVGVRPALWVSIGE